MTILINPHDLTRLVYVDHDAGYVALQIGNDCLTVTNIDKDLAVINGETHKLALKPAFVGVVAQLIDPEVFEEESNSKDNDDPPAEQSNATKPKTGLADHEPHDDDDSAPARQGSAKVKIGQQVLRHGKGPSYIVSRVRNQGPEEWPTVWLVAEDGAVKTATAAPNFARYWQSLAYLS